uniref:Uncharacterized protein n=1 Tax=Arundo donax TaxID=35708 RepID=A0A0A9ARD7_ARUDO
MILVALCFEVPHNGHHATRKTKKLRYDFSLLLRCRARSCRLKHGCNLMLYLHFVYIWDTLFGLFFHIEHHMCSALL